MNHYLACILFATFGLVLLAAVIGSWPGMSKRKECLGEPISDKEDEG